MYMSLEGVRGICCGSFCFLDAADDPVGCRADCLESGRAGDDVAADAVFAFDTSGLSVGSGGGKGEIEIQVTDAECAWYTRRG